MVTETTTGVIRDIPKSTWLCSWLWLSAWINLLLLRSVRDSALEPHFRLFSQKIQVIDWAIKLVTSTLIEHIPWIIHALRMHEWATMSLTLALVMLISWWCGKAIWSLVKHVITFNLWCEVIISILIHLLLSHLVLWCSHSHVTYIFIILINIFVPMLNLHLSFLFKVNIPIICCTRETAKPTSFLLWWVLLLHILKHLFLLLGLLLIKSLQLIQLIFVYSIVLVVLLLILICHFLQVVSPTIADWRSISHHF